MTARKRKAGAASGADWLAALRAEKLEVKSARDALQVKGWLDTGNFALNWAISGRFSRGYPLGHTVEIFGDPSTGKSFLATRAMAMAQSAGGLVLLDDVEGAYNAEHAEKLGVQTQLLAYKRSRLVKDHLATTMAFIGAFAKMDAPLGVLVCDSLAQLTTTHEVETQLDRRDMTKAVELKAFFRIIAGPLLDLPVVYISTNHVVAAIGNRFQSRTTSGGGGAKYQASVRLDMRAISKVKRGNDYIGTICRAVVDKNRVTAPWKEVQLAIPFEKPISRVSGIIPLLTAMGVLTARGQFLLYKDQKLGRAYTTKQRFIDADEVAEGMLDRFPEILEETDEALANGAVHWSAGGAAEEESADDDEEVTE